MVSAFSTTLTTQQEHAVGFGVSWRCLWLNQLGSKGCYPWWKIMYQNFHKFHKCTSMSGMHTLIKMHMFNVRIWNVYNKQDRTNNISERFHSALNKAIGHQHPSIYRVVQFFKDKDDGQEQLLAQLIHRAAPTAWEKKYVRVNEALFRLVENTFGQAAIPSSTQIIRYMDAAAYQLWDNK